jgi:uncharacterized coiled-coil protein SlyX
MKSQFDTCATVLRITQEKVELLEDKANKQEQLILNLNGVITNKDTIISQKVNIIDLRNDRITLLESNNKKKFWNGLLTGVAVGASVVVVLLGL